MTNCTSSLIEKLEAKIHGNYSEKEAYGRGLDQGFRVAIDLIRQHEAETKQPYIPAMTHADEALASLDNQPIFDDEGNCMHSGKSVKDTNSPVSIHSPEDVNKPDTLIEIIDAKVQEQRPKIHDEKGDLDFFENGKFWAYKEIQKYLHENINPENHCVDCCCARAWKALGITQYTGKSIAEHITELRQPKTSIDPVADEMKECRKAFELVYMEHYGLDMPPSYIDGSYMEPRTRAAYHFFVRGWHDYQRPSEMLDNFPEWAKRNFQDGCDLNFDTNTNQYRNPFVQHAWFGWQGRGATKREEIGLSNNERASLWKELFAHAPTIPLSISTTRRSGQNGLRNVEEVVCSLLSVIERNHTITPKPNSNSIEGQS